MQELLVVAAGCIGLFAYLVQRKRRMAAVMADAAHEAPAATCSLPGAAALYDETRWLRIALEGADTGGTKAKVRLTGDGIGLAVKHRTPGVSQDRIDHALRLSEAVRSLDPGARGVLHAQGLDAQLIHVAESAAHSVNKAQRRELVAVLRQAEAVLTAPAAAG